MINKGTLEKEEVPKIKIILLGDPVVGKSKLVARFVDGEYKENDQNSTYALSIFKKNLTIGDSTVYTEVWDTAGQERFKSLHPSYYFQADVCILVFDVTRKPTYVHLKKWYKELRSFCPNIPVVLVANKCDVDYLVTKKSFKFPSQYNLPFFFTSSADGTNVSKVFEESVCAALGHKKFGSNDFLSECLNLFDD